MLDIVDITGSIYDHTRRKICKINEADITRYECTNNNVVEAQPANYRYTLYFQFNDDDDDLEPLLCTWQAKWAERPPKVMKRSQR